MSNLTLEGLKEALRETFGAPSAGNSRPPTASGDSGGTASTGVINRLLSTFGDIVREGAPVATAFTTIGKSSTAFIDTLEKVGKFSPLLGGVVSSLAKSQDELRAFSAQGLGAGNFTAIQSNSNRAGFTVGEFADTMGKYNKITQGLASTANESVTIFQKIGEQAQYTAVGNNLKVMNQLLPRTLGEAAMVMSAYSKEQLNSAEAQKKMGQSTALLMNQLDQTAKATGQNREAMLQELAARLALPENEMKMRQMTEEQRKSYVMMQAQMMGASASTRDLIDTLTQGARLSEGNKQTMLAMGPAFKELELANRMKQYAGDDPVKQKMAQDQMAKYERVQANWLNSAQFQRQAASAKGTPLGQAMTELYAEDRRRAGLQASAREIGTPGGVVTQQAQAAQLTRVVRDQYALDPRTGQRDVGRETQTVIGRGQEDTRITAAAGSEALKRFNDELGRSPKLLDTLTTGIQTATGVRGPTTVDQQADRLIQSGRNLTGAANTSTAPNANLPPPGGRLPPVEKTRAHGTIDSVGKLIEDFMPNERIKVHPKEGVYREDDLKLIIKAAEKRALESTDKITTGGMKDVVSNISRIKVPEMPQIPKITMPEIKFPDMSKIVPPAPASAPTPELPAPETVGANQNDIMTALLSGIEQLNKNTMQMVSNTQSISEASVKTARMTGKLSGNRVG